MKTDVDGLRSRVCKSGKQGDASLLCCLDMDLIVQFDKVGF
jgi:hypothetical protein